MNTTTVARIDAIQAEVTTQANDEGLWFIPETITEAYLQAALRRLHAIIEGKTPEECTHETMRRLVKGA